MEAIRPVALYFIGMAIMMGALYLPGERRMALVGPVWSILALSFWDINKLPSTLGLNVQLGMLNIITILYCPFLFWSFDGRLYVMGGDYGDLVSAYRLFNNPRRIPVHIASRTQPPQTRRLPERPRANGSERLLFASRRLLQGCAIVACRWARDLILSPHLATYTLVDFSPSHEWLFRRLLSGRITSHELGVRICVSFSWIAETYAQLTLIHLLLSVFFVAFLGVDEPAEWPSLFSSPLEAYTLRRFWGRFWHRLITPSASAWARFLWSNALPLPSTLRHHRAIGAVFTAWFIFTISGVAHMLVGWRLGDVALMRDVYFFWANFGAIGGEIVLTRITSRTSDGMSQRLDISPRPPKGTSFLFQGLGYVWVMSWFMLTIPHVLYPKMHYGILQALFPQM
ncbi:membrane bound o-acyl transferase family protein [Sarocladium implicatum]|nr:membrane bound o-acyl transferase family protein [Sarocladium implicatum]